VALAGVLALALAAIALALALGPGRRSGPTPPALTLDAPAGRAIRITDDPVGLSIEYPLLVHDLGSGPCPPAAFVRAIAGLGSPVLRIGGDSQDEIAPAGTPPHAGISDLPRRFWQQLGCLERETGIPVVVGLNIAWGKPAWALKLGAGARSAIPAGRLSFELGNEPDILGDPVKWWNGRTLVENRMPMSTYLARARALESALGPGARVEGPDFASGRWTAAVPAIAQTLHLTAIDAHYYPLEGCKGHDGATSAALLGRQIQTKLDERVSFARDARAAGLGAVISEANSVSCGGVSGVSDQPATAVWALRMIVTALRDGFDAVRFHSSGGSYDPFVLAGAAVVTRPLYVGLQAAAELLPAGATLRAIPNATALDGVAIDGPGTLRTVLLSNYGTRPRRVDLAAAASASVLRLVAHTPTAQRVTLAPAGGLLELQLPPNSVEAVTLPAQAAAST
jgi:hypothetical protein